MSRSYYFTVSSLPSLSLDQSAPLDWAEFVTSLRTEINPKDSKLLSGAVIDPADKEAIPPGSVSSRYLEWETSLRNDLVRIRAALTNRDPQPWLRTGESCYDTQSIAQNAGRIDSPLEAEDFLDHARWKKIDELAAGEYFNVQWLEAYALKLKILLRRNLFNRERGQRKYGELYEEILKKSDTELTSGESNG